MTHAQIPLSLIVVKWDRKIVQESQHRSLLRREAIKQIASRTLLGSSWHSLTLFRLPWWTGSRIGKVALREDLVVAPQ